jgi:hypothetical protein
MSGATDGVAAEGEQVVAGKRLRSAALTGAAAAAPWPAPILAELPVTAVRRFVPGVEGAMIRPVPQSRSV